MTYDAFIVDKLINSFMSKFLIANVGMGVLTCYMKVCYGLSKVTTGENNHLDSETENLENLLLYDEGKNLSTSSGIGNLEV